MALSLLPNALTALASSLRVSLPTPSYQIIETDHGTHLGDIVTDNDNRAAANAILSVIQAATSDPDRDLHVSIAGGRKTMGCLAGIALSLCARPGDQLSHVLVDPRLQGRENFFFPPVSPEWHDMPDGSRISTADHGLSLAQIPFVRLRGLIRTEKLSGGFATVVAAVQQSLEPASLTISLPERVIICNKIRIPLSASLLAVQLMFAERVLHGRGPMQLGKAPDADLTAVYRQAYRRSGGRAKVTELDRAWLSEKISRLNQKLLPALGTAAVTFITRREGRRPNTGYRLGLSANAIRIVEATP